VSALPNNGLELTRSAMASNAALAAQPGVLLTRGSCGSRAREIGRVAGRRERDMAGGGRLEIGSGAHVTASAARNAVEETYALEQAARRRRRVSRRRFLQGHAVEQPDAADGAR
jgi:hypothetical protein